MKKVIGSIGNLSKAITWQMMRALLSKPMLFLPTVWATVESVLMAEKYFLEAHGGRGLANAFRHAAWNLLIAKNCSFFTSSQKALEWAEFTTDLHEEIFPNQDFDREMDLHNNRVGRQFFSSLNSKEKKSKSEMIRELLNKSKSAVGLEDEKRFHLYPNELVYFKEVANKLDTDLNSF